MVFNKFDMKARAAASNTTYLLGITVCVHIIATATSRDITSCAFIYRQADARFLQNTLQVT